MFCKLTRNRERSSQAVGSAAGVFGSSMSYNSPRSRWAFAALCLMFFSVPCAYAQKTERDGVWDAGFHLQHTSSVSLDGTSGSSLTVDGAVGYGFSGSYNFSNHWALGLDTSWLSPHYRATFVPDGATAPDTIETNMDIVRIHAKGIYYFRDADLTPFVQIGVGWSQIDSNIINGPPVTGCWWDPWWGYVCRNYYTTYTETRPSYSAAVGVRWDMPLTGLSVRGSIGKLEVETPKSVQNANMNTVQFELLWHF